jgi:methylthioribose-1-phosphate isomerase
VALIEEISRRKNGAPVNILTHCNAGWLACIDYGTVTSPVYLACDRNIPVHVWVDETRPRNQGARLTSFELANENIPHTLIVDNTGGHLMQHGMVDIVITGSDRTVLSGDTANKIGTYLKALAAKDNNIPFYVAVPSSSIDFKIRDGIKEIPVEERDPSEITEVQGLSEGKIISVRICPDYTKAVNFGFDITPSRLISGLITERGICKASETDLKNMFTDKLEQNYGRGC